MNPHPIELELLDEIVELDELEVSLELEPSLEELPPTLSMSGLDEELESPTLLELLPKSIADEDESPEVEDSPPPPDAAANRESF